MKYHLIRKQKGLYCSAMDDIEVGDALPCVDPDNLPKSLTFVDICAECARLFIINKRAETQ